jgi:hypothetical protein
VTKFGIVFLVVLAGAAVIGLWRGRAGEPPRDDRNQRLTALAGAALYILLVAIVVTVLDISGLLSAHYMVGFLLIPPVLLKLGSTGYRFVRYYAGDEPYHRAGAPPILLRFVVAPVLVASTVVVFGTGLELWLFGFQFGSGWMEAHTASAVAMLLAAGAHLLAHARRSTEVLLSEAVGGAREALAGRPLVVASLLLGAALAMASLFYASPFPAAAAGG